MRPRIDGRKEKVHAFIQQYYKENDSAPSEMDISSGTGIPPASVHRLIVEMRENGEISYEGRRSIRTADMEKVSEKKIIPVLRYVACDPGEEEEEQFVEYIHMSESVVGKGEFFALIAKEESMVGAGIHPGDYVIVRRQQTAEDGDIVVALLEGKNNLKELACEDGQYILRSRNPDAERFPDIIPEAGEELRIQGLAVGVYHTLMQGK